MAAEKRPASDAFGSSQLVVKRQKSNVNLSDGKAIAVTNGNAAAGGALVQAVPRTSGLQSPIMELTGRSDPEGFSILIEADWEQGHTGEVFATRFDATGQLIASGSMDRSIMLWRTYGQCDNFGILTGHRGAILDLQWSRDSRILFSASADTTVASWDLETGLRIRRHEGHEEVINCLDISRRGEEILVSGSDDGYICIWDPRQKRSIDDVDTGFPITSVAIAEAGHELYTGGIDNDIKVWDLRKQTVVYTMTGHTDTVTSLHQSPDTQALLSYSHDGTARTWDIRPFAPADRQIKAYTGAPPGLEKNLVRASWNSKGDRIAAGSGDGTAVVWDAPSGSMLYKLPGHRGTVNDIRFAPGDEPIIVSGSSDRNLILGELGN